MKMSVVLILVILGFYWLVDHYAPLPLNHEGFGFYEHNIHRVVGIVLLVIAGLVFWKWNPKKN